MLVVLSSSCLEEVLAVSQWALDDFRTKPIFLLRVELRWVPLFCSSFLLLLPNTDEEPPRIVRLRRRAGQLSTTQADVATGASAAAEDDAVGASPAADEACWSIE